MNSRPATLASVAVFLFPCLAAHAQLAGANPASTASVNNAAIKGNLAESAKPISLPIRQISLYKDGVGLFERSGKIDGNALVQIDFTTAELNDALQSLTAVDNGGGTVAGVGFDSTATLQQQLDSLSLGLGPNPTVTDFIHALKGTRVEISGPKPVIGKILSVEVREQRNPKTGLLVEHRILSIVTDVGGLRNAELTPSTEVRMLDSAQKREIGRYLQLLATSHEPSIRHLTLEDKGTGPRMLHISYISAVPAWKSNYRILFNNGQRNAAGVETATLQGWAVVDNTSAADWDNIQLNLISGAPQSFIQPISRPNNIGRPEIGMNGTSIPRLPRSVDPIPSAESQSFPISAASIGGGEGVQIQLAAIATPPAPAPAAQPTDSDDYESTAAKTLAPQTGAVDHDDLFEYKLSKPLTVLKNQSLAIPILQTTVEAQRVSVWSGRERNAGVQRALWLRNTSPLTLDQGSFTITEDGIFGGQGQIPVLHPAERKLAAYGVDQAVKVDVHEAKDPPAILRRIVVVNGTLSLHYHFYKEHVYDIQNNAASPRTVVLGVPQSDHLNAEVSANIAAAIPIQLRTIRGMGTWDLSRQSPADEIIGNGNSNKLYRFQIQVDPSSTQTFKVFEWHSHPVHHPLSGISPEQLAEIVKQSGNNTDVAAKLQPLLDAKRQLAACDQQLKTAQKSMDEATAEESRIRQNIASLKGSAEEKPLAKRYSAELIAQEDKLATLRTQRDSLQQQRDTIAKTVEDQIRTLSMDVGIPAAGAI